MGYNMLHNKLLRILIASKISNNCLLVINVENMFRKDDSRLGI